jgi:amidase
MDAYVCLRSDKSRFLILVLFSSIVGVLGPLARSARDLSLFCSVMLAAKPWLLEAPLLEMPWKDDVANGVGLPPKLSFAMVWDDGVVAPHPPLIQALHRAKRALIGAGHEVIDWVPINHQEGWDLIVSHPESP